MKKHSLYIASPLFSEEDHRQLDIIEGFLDREGISYFSPRKKSKIDFSKAKTPEGRNEIAKEIYDLNMDGIDNAHFVLVNTKGIFWDKAVYTDQGTCFELGYAAGKNIPIVTFNFDGFDLNIMFSQKVVSHLKLKDSLDPLEKLLQMHGDLISGKSDTELRMKWSGMVESFELNT